MTNKTRATHIQHEILVAFMEEHTEFARSGQKYAANRSRNDYTEKWNEITNTLNSKEFGPARTWKAWCKCWSDMKFAARKKAYVQKQFQAGIVDKKSKLSKLNSWDLRILAAIGEDPNNGVTIKPKKPKSTSCGRFKKMMKIESPVTTSDSSLSSSPESKSPANQEPQIITIQAIKEIPPDPSDSNIETNTNVFNTESIEIQKQTLQIQKQTLELQQEMVTICKQSLEVLREILWAQQTKK